MVAQKATKSQIIAAYKRGMTLREVGRHLGISMQRVHQVISDCAPELMRPRFDRFTLSRKKA
jgi:DNA-directed RNA polymerase specialized sigma subunit